MCKEEAITRMMSVGMLEVEFNGAWEVVTSLGICQSFTVVEGRKISVGHVLGVMAAGGGGGFSEKTGFVKLRYSPLGR